MSKFFEFSSPICVFRLYTLTSFHSSDLPYLHHQQANCGAEHDVKFEKRPAKLRLSNGNNNSSSSSSNSGSSAASFSSSFSASANHARAATSATLCKSAPLLSYPCTATDFHQLVHAQFGHLVNSHDHHQDSHHHYRRYPNQDSNTQLQSLRYRSSGGGGDDRNRLRQGDGEESGVAVPKKKRRALDDRGADRAGLTASAMAADYDQASISQDEEFVSLPESTFSHDQRRRTTAVSPPLATLLSVAGEAGSIVTKGLYAYHLRSWLKHFPPTQLKVLIFSFTALNVPLDSITQCKRRVER